LGTAFATLTTNEGHTVATKFSLGTTFAGAAQTTGNDLISVVVRQYKLGKSKDFQIRISSSGSSIVQYQWKFAEDATYSAPANLATATAYCNSANPCELVNSGNSDSTATGVYVWVNYFNTDLSTTAGDISDASAANDISVGNTYEFSVDHLEGSAYETGNSNLAHMEVECSGSGLCDSSTGRCACFDGFSGEACQRTTCPSDCSGHGVCQSQSRFASDASATYSGAYDASKEMGCACDDGFRGADCAQVECPSGDDPMGGAGGDGASSTVAMDCSGRGLCDYSSGSCSCFKGFYGERCEYQTNFV